MKILFRGLSFFPLWALHGLGWLLGWASFCLSPTYRRRFRDHAQQAGMTWAEVHGAVGQAGRLVAELPYLWMRPAGQTLGRRLKMVGADLIEEALSKGKGVVFLTPHLGSFEVAAQAYAEAYGRQRPITVLYRPARKAWMRELVDVSRSREGLQTAPATMAGVRQMLRALKKGEAVGLLPDQVPPMGMGVWAPFFGRPAYTMTLAARLAQQTGAAVVLAWCRRLSFGRGYEVICEPMPHLLPQDPEQRLESATAINRAMELLIRRCPQQYLWGYNRYKIPAGDLQLAGD